MRIVAAAVVGGTLVFGLLESFAQDQTTAPLVVIDAAGKEITLSKWKFTQGTKHLSWLAERKKEPVDPNPKRDQTKQNDPDKGEPKKAEPKKPVAKKGPTPPEGPECLAIVEQKTPTYVNDIMTFIPVGSLKQIDYDHDKETIRVTFVTSGGKEETLAAGKFSNLNRIALEGESAPAALSVSGKVQLQDGFLKGDVRGYRFANPKPAAEPKGPWATIVARDDKKSVHKIAGLTPLYKTADGYQTANFLVFQKSVKIDFARISQMTMLPSKTKKGVVLDFDVTQQEGGGKQGLTLLEKVGLDDNQPATLVGLVGQVSAGYKLFPPHIISELRMKE